MSTNMNDLKNHPGFMPFGCSNVKIDSNSQSKKESQKDLEDKTKDQQKA